MDDIFRRIFQVITEKRNDSPFILGINGVDGSGKTIFSRKLKKFLRQKGLNTCLIHIDDFHNHLKKRREGPNENQAYIDNAFNLQLLEEKILKPLRENGELKTELTLLDLEADTYTLQREYSIEKDTIILLEGVLLFREPIEKYIDYRIYLDIPFEVSIARCIQRANYTNKEDIERSRARSLEKYVPIHKWYIKKYNPREISDMLIENSDYENPYIIK